MKILVVGDFQGSFPEKLKKKVSKEDFNLVLCVGDYGGIADWRPWVMQNLRDARKGKEYLTAEEYFGKKKIKLLMKKDEKAAKSVLLTLDRLDKPIASVFGNTDDGWYDYPFGKNKIKAEKRLRKFVKRLKNINDITYAQKKLVGINVIGFGGYMDIEAYLDKKVFPESKDRATHRARLRRLQNSRKNLFSRLKKTKGEKIFLLHYPPLGAFDIIKDTKDNPMNGKSAGVRFFREAIKKYKPKLVLCGHMHEYQGAKRLGSSLVINPGDAEKGKYAIVDYPSLKVKFSR
jgi:Icc-related predicted phosphoesterase